MFEASEPSFDRPIPGQSLTAEVGSRPWQQPPQYNTVEEALNYYIPRLANPQIIKSLYDVMESGVPLVNIAEAAQLAGVMEGKHTIDVGVLITPVLVETMAYLAEEADIDYVLGNSNEEEPDKVSDSAMSAVLAKLEKKKQANEKEEPKKETEEEPEEEPKGGLMARRNNNGV